MRQCRNEFDKERVPSLGATVKMKVLYFVFLCVSLYIYVEGQKAPFITPCRAADSACLKSSAQRAVAVLAAGVPALGIQTMDPMLVESVVAKQAGLSMDFKNTVVRGLKDCVVDSLKRHGPQTNLDLRCSVTLVGDYTLGGKLLIFPIEGKGRYKIIIRDILVKIVFQVSEREQAGVRFWRVHGWQHTAQVLTSAQYHFQNLFNGNKVLSDTVHQFANTSWREIFQEVAPPIVKAIVSTIVNEVQKLFDNVPAAELAL